MTDYEALAGYVLETAARKKPLLAEVFIIDSREFAIEAANQKTENLRVAQERGLGLRVIADSRLGYAFTSDLSKGALEMVVEKAVYNAKQAIPDEYLTLPEPSFSFPAIKIFDGKAFNVSFEEKLNMVCKMEESARQYDSRVRITEKSVYQDVRYTCSLYNSKGFARSYEGSYCGVYIVVASQEGDDSQTGFAMQFEASYDLLTPEEIGKEAAKRAVRMLGAGQIPSATMPVVMDPYTAANFLGVLQTALSGEAMLKGKSFWEGQEEKQVASPFITIIDDGTLPGRIGSAPYDGEGVPSARTILIREGMLEGFLHNTYTAARLGKRSTGNGSRHSYKSTPEVGITNLYIKEGHTPPAQLLSGIAKGLYLTDVLGLHTANPVTGDFSVGAAGLLIENGELTRPVQGIAVAGNLREMLLDIDAVGNDLKFFLGKGAPTVRVKQMSVSGT